jgi:polar amino acid transport system substrate-binding protein
MRNRGVTAVLALAIAAVTACSNAAAPTAAPTPSPAPTTTAAPTPTAAPTATPTIAPTPTAAPPSATPTAAPPTASPTPTAPPTPSPSPSPSPAPTVAAECQAANLKTLTAGKLTISADNPAFPPYYQPSDPADPAWELGNPNNGMGLEAATAYAVAAKLGFAKEAVTWVASAGFNNVIKPGAKPFDLYLTQVSYSTERAQAVDLSDGYFDVNQAVVALAANPIAKVTDVAGLKAFKLGAQVGTTSYSYITDQIKPDTAPLVYDSNDAAIAALKAKQIDGIVADLPTTFYMRDAQLDGGVIVGSLPTVGTPEHFSILLTKGSALTTCVNQALAAVKADGTLSAIVTEWIVKQGAPELK